MAVKRVDPKEAADLLALGWSYVDVRSIPEYEQGHPSGAYNVPLMHAQPGRGMVANPDFAAVMSGRFGLDDKLVVGCRSGARSSRAADQLAAAGYTNVVDMRGGFLGEMDPAGQVTCAGWQPRGLPVSREPAAGRSYQDLRAKKS